MVRYRKRYYVFYNHWDSYPEGLGKDLVAQIPTDPEEYQKWLAAQREEAAKWEEQLEPFLCIKNVVEGSDEDDEDSNDEKNCSVYHRLVNFTKTQGGLPTFIAEGYFPAFWPGFTDIMIEWTYTFDLDREIFSVDSGAHLNMQHILRESWIDALDLSPREGFRTTRLLLPDLVPEGCNASLVWDCPPPSSKMLHAYRNLQVDIVKPKGISSISPVRRHAVLFGREILAMVEESYRQILSATLLSWGTDDLVFREFAHATLCLALFDGGCSLISKADILIRSQLPFLELHRREGETSPEFVADLGIGCHLEGVEPGSAPNTTMYWLAGVLVHLVPRLDLPGRIDEAVAGTVQHCSDRHIELPVNAVLTSIEYVVLLRIFSGGVVEHTVLLPLLDIKSHITMDARERYGADYVNAVQKPQLEELAAKKAAELKAEDSPQEIYKPSKMLDEQSMMKNFDDFLCGRRDTIIDNPPDDLNAVKNKAVDPDSGQEDIERSAVKEGKLLAQDTQVDSSAQTATEGKEDQSNLTQLSPPLEASCGSSDSMGVDSQSKGVENGIAEQDETQKENPSDDGFAGAGSDDDQSEEEKSVDLATLIPRRAPKDTESTFVALFHLFDASARQHMSKSKRTQGRLPPEIYELIINHVADLATYRACAKVSRIFRDLCQQHLMLLDNVSFIPHESTKVYSGVKGGEEETDKYGDRVCRLQFHTFDKTNGSEEDLRILATEGPMDMGFGNYKGYQSRWRVVVGSERNRRSQLAGFAIGAKSGPLMA
ncbi:MAG: hypothetical protein Q9190_004280 [Brigantiaea leucoxantha]